MKIMKIKKFFHITKKNLAILYLFKYNININIKKKNNF